MTVIAYAAAPMIALWLRMITDGVVDRQLATALLGAALFAISGGAMYVISIMAANHRLSLREYVERTMDDQLMVFAAEIPTVRHFENPGFYRMIEAVRRSNQSMGGAVGAVVMNLGSNVRLLIVVVLLGLVHPLLLGPALLTIPSLWLGLRSETRLDGAKESVSDERRLARRFFELAIGAGPAKEIRAYSAEEFVLDAYLMSHTRARTVVSREYTRASVMSLAAAFVMTCSLVIAAVVVGARAANGRATPGEVIQVMALVSMLNAAVGGSLEMGRWLGSVLSAVRHLTAIEDFVRVSTPQAMSDGRVITRIERSVRFSDVWFTYSDEGPSALAGAELELAPGSVTALVGNNGAGKSTLIKLLCGLYQPTYGGISVDGVPLDELDVAAYRQRIAPVFQDFWRFETTLREACGIGNIARVSDGEVVRSALRKAGDAQWIDQLPSGLDTPLGRTWTEGVDLSEGQWQKVALGRAFMRESPLITIFDEPTSAMDAESERQMLNALLGAASGRSSSAVTLLVSHRFSTVSRADLIVFVADGRVVEVGTHSELVQRDGLYASAYAAQREAFGV